MQRKGKFRYAVPIANTECDFDHFPVGEMVPQCIEQRIANLFITMMQSMGLTDMTFGDTGTGPLGQLA